VIRLRSLFGRANPKSACDSDGKSKKQSNGLAAVTYALGDLLTKGAKFLLLPLYLAYFTADEIGALAALQAVSLGITPMFTAGISMAVTRFYQEYEPRSEQLVATLLVVGIAIASLGAGAIALAYLLLPIQWGPYFDTATVMIWLFSGFLCSISQILERRFIIRGEALNFRALTFSQFCFSTALIFVLVLCTDLRLFGIALAESIAFGGTFCFLAIRLLSKHRPDFSLINWRSIWRYASPLAFHAFCTWAVCYADRVILGQFVPLATVGVYHIGYLCATVVSIISLSIKNAWLPDFFRQAEGDQETGSRFSDWLVSYYAFILTLVIGVVCLGPPAAELFLPENYSESLIIIKMISVSLIFHAMLIALLNPLYYHCRTKTIALISAGSLVVNIVAMFAFVPIIGIRGAATATILAYASGMTLAYWQAAKHYVMQLQWGLVLRSSLLFSFVFCLSLITPDQWGWRMAWGTLCFLLYVSVTYFASGMFLSKECQTVISKSLERVKLRLKFS
jgi:O-antigen/teichoic acid export membrane protein